MSGEGTQKRSGSRDDPTRGRRPTRVPAVLWEMGSDSPLIGGGGESGAPRFAQAAGGAVSRRNTQPPQGRLFATRVKKDSGRDK